MTAMMIIVLMMVAMMMVIDYDGNDNVDYYGDDGGDDM